MSNPPTTDAPEAGTEPKKGPNKCCKCFLYGTMVALLAGYVGGSTYAFLSGVWLLGTNECDYVSNVGIVAKVKNTARQLRCADPAEGKGSLVYLSCPVQLHDFAEDESYKQIAPFYGSLRAGCLTFDVEQWNGTAWEGCDGQTLSNDSCRPSFLVDVVPNGSVTLGDEGLPRYALDTGLIEEMPHVTLMPLIQAQSSTLNADKQLWANQSHVHVGAVLKVETPGDLRFSVEACKAKAVSVVARTSEPEKDMVMLGEWDSGISSTPEFSRVEWLANGTVSLEQMAKNEQSHAAEYLTEGRYSGFWLIAWGFALAAASPMTFFGMDKMGCCKSSGADEFTSCIGACIWCVCAVVTMPISFVISLIVILCSKLAANTVGVAGVAILVALITLGGLYGVYRTYVWFKAKQLEEEQKGAYVQTEA